MEVVVRPGGAGDLAAVLALWRRAGLAPGVTDDEAGLATLLAADAGALLVAETDGRPVGALIAAWDGWRGGLYRLAVDPGYRRRGIGRRLVAAGEERLGRRGARRIAAPLDADDPQAVAFWRAAGYQPDSRSARFVKDVGAR